jgi:hypothetical protein
MVGVRLGVKCGGSLTTARGCIFADAADSLQGVPYGLRRCRDWPGRSVREEI